MNELNFELEVSCGKRTCQISSLHVNLFIFNSCVVVLVRRGLDQEANYTRVFMCVVVQQRIKGRQYVTSAIPDGAFSREEGAITGRRLFRKESSAPTRRGAHSRFAPRECTSLAFKLFMFNAPR